MTDRHELEDWAWRWSLPPSAVDELVTLLSAPSLIVAPDPDPGHSEVAVQSRAQLEWARMGGAPWRNNRGAFEDLTGRWVRYGLANDSVDMNKRVKSSDLIGVLPVRVKPHHVGRVFGVFTAVECKSSDWVYKATEHERCQLKYLQIVNSLGGLAMFCNDHKQLRKVIGERLK